MFLININKPPPSWRNNWLWYSIKNIFPSYPFGHCKIFWKKSSQCLNVLIRHVSLIFANSSNTLVEGTQIPPGINQISFLFTTVQWAISQCLWKSCGRLSGRMYLLVCLPRCQQECRGCTLEPWCFGFPQQQQLIQARSIIKTTMAVRERI